MQTASEADAAQRSARGVLVPLHPNVRRHSPLARPPEHLLASRVLVLDGSPILHRRERQSTHQAGFDHNCLVIQPTCTRQNRTTGHRVPSLAIHPMAERPRRPSPPSPLRSYYSLDPLGPGGRLVGSGNLCGGACPFEGLSERKTRWLLPNTQFP